MHGRRRHASSLLVALTLAATVACTSGADDSVLEGDAVGPTSAVTDADSGADAGEVFTPADTDPGGAPATTADLGPVPPPLPTDAVSDSVLDPIEPVPDTGVPGIESDDDFCRSWSEFAGSYQALTFSWAVVGGADSARLEIVANDALRSAVDAMARTLPAELEPEREALTVELTTPILRRAERSRELLEAAGVGADDNAALAELWLAALTDAGTESEDLVVPVADPTLDAAVAEAAAALIDSLPPITEDPSLIVDVAIPATEVYLFDNCPDRGILAGNDNVDA